MSQQRYDIFISYRRDGGFETAKHLNDLLIYDGYSVSFDIDTLREGDFDDALFKRIDQCVDFILIVDQHAFDRCIDQSFNPKRDWLRKELSYALKLKKNIVPVMLPGVKGYPTNLPEDISKIAFRNGPEYNKYYFDEFYKRLKTFLHSVPRYNENQNLSIKQNRNTFNPKTIIITVVAFISIMLFFVFFYIVQYAETLQTMRELVVLQKEGKTGIREQWQVSNDKIASLSNEEKKSWITKNGFIIEKSEAVDLGLTSGTLWASRNLGADYPYDFGSYYAWGEVYTKEIYWNSNYIYKSIDLELCLSSNLSIIHTQYDAATFTWGMNWAMPSVAQIKELIRECKWSWTSLNNIPGYVIQGPNMNSIFLPAGGCYCADHGTGKLEGCTVECIYWTGDIIPKLSGMAGVLIMSKELELYNDSYGNVADGKLIRPVYFTTR